MLDDLADTCRYLWEVIIDSVKKKTGAVRQQATTWIGGDQYLNGHKALHVHNELFGRNFGDNAIDDNVIDAWIR